MRTFLRGKVTLLFMMLGMLLAIPAVALAADVVSDVNADLSSSVSTPTWVGANADKNFQIKVWAVGNYNNINDSGRTGQVEVVKNYETFLNTTWQIRGGSSGNGTVLATDKQTVDFEAGLTDAGYNLSSLSSFHYTNDCPTTGTVPKGCPANPFVVTGKLSVGNVPNGTAMSLRDAFGTAAPGFTVNSSSLDTGFVKVDAVKPTVTLTTPANNATYDLNQSVNASYSCSDSDSGLKATGGCVGTVNSGSAIDTSSTGTKSFTVTATDNVGNVQTVTHNYTVVNPDSTAPTSTASGTVPDGDDAGTDPDPYTSGSWTNKNVTVSLNASDNVSGSGVKELTYSATGAQTITSTTVPANQLPKELPVINTEGTTTISFYAEDNNGNVETAKTFVVKIDKTAPLANCGSASANWLGVDASIACNPTDSGGSGLAGSVPSTFNLVTSVPADTEDNNASTDSRTISDVAGNTATAGPITGNKIDKKAPGFSCDAPDGLWHATNVSLGCTASDGGSGLTPSGDATFSLSTSVVAGNETSNAATGTKGLSDAVGNTVTAGPISGNKVDMKGPAITLTTPANNAAYTLGQTVNANYGCNDFGSGLLSCSGTVNSGSPIDTSTIGTHSFAVNAEDNVGNKSNASSSYSVAAAFNGFLQPIDGNLVNTGKFGRVYPVKWQLKDSSQNLISDAAAEALVSSMTVKQAATNCTTGAADALETEAGAAGSTSVRYDATSDQFIFNYKAPSSGTCYALNINKADGINTQTIQFKFTK